MVNLRENRVQRGLNTILDDAFGKKTKEDGFITPSKMISQHINYLAIHSLEEAEKLIQDAPNSFLLKKACKKVSNSIYFCNKATANHYFQMMKVLSSKIDECQKQILACCEEQKNAIEKGTSISLSKKTSLEQALKNSEKEFNQGKSISKRIKKSLEGQYYASKHVENDNSSSAIQASAFKAKQIYDNYCTAMSHNLMMNGADMSNKKALKAIMEPPFLFSRYGILKRGKGLLREENKFPFTFVKNQQGSPHFCTIRFEYGRGELGYTLKGSDVDLEKEIRNDLADKVSTYEIPPQLLKSLNVSSDESPRYAEIQEKFCPKFERWYFLTEEERGKTLEDLIKYNGWGQFGVEANDIKLEIQLLIASENGQNRGVQVIKGFLLKDGKVYRPLYFNTHDFNLVIKTAAFDEDSQENSLLFLAAYQKKTKIKSDMQAISKTTPGEEWLKEEFKIDEVFWKAYQNDFEEIEVDPQFYNDPYKYILTWQKHDGEMCSPEAIYLRGQLALRYLGLDWNKHRQELIKKRLL